MPDGQPALDGRTREDALVVTYTDCKTRRRTRFEPRSAGGWWRVEERWTGDGWDPVGCEIVSHVSVERGAEVLD